MATKGYGNHSCNDCRLKSRCNLKKTIANHSTPNTCGFYWPPNETSQPSQRILNQVAKDQ